MRRSLREFESSWMWGCLVWMATSGFLASPAAAQCPPQWLPGEGITGASGPIYATTTWDPDGPGPRSEVLVVGGCFQIAGTVLANNIACWDPSTSEWSALGPGIGGSISSTVHAVAVLDGKLYAGGNFDTAGEVSVSEVACWDPTTSTWSPLGSGLGGDGSSHVRALCVLDGRLYAGGRFSIAGGANVSHIACWDPATAAWSPLGTGTDQPTNAMISSDGRLYVAGEFTTAGGATANKIACWDPVTSSWSTLGTGIDGTGVYALAVLGGSIYAGGLYAGAGGISTPNIACWDPSTSTWSSLPGTDASVNALTILDGRLYAGGAFLNAGGVRADRVACWDPSTSTWSPMGLGTYGQVECLAALGGKVYAGGWFPTAGGQSVNRIACWDPVMSNWSALSEEGADKPVMAFTVLDGRLYAGGDFTAIGGTSANRVACWDPATQTWSARGSGVPGSVWSLAALDGKLYVGGNFNTIGGIDARKIACWDPVTQTWSAMGSGVSGPESPGVCTLAALGGSLYAAGSFITAGGVSAKNIACWSPVSQTWSALGSGITASGFPCAGVNALTVLDGRLYAGGAFLKAGEVSTTGVACWDPATLTWSSVGLGTNNSVECLTVLDGKLYAGGHFTTAGDVSALGIACWDPAASCWSALGSGISGGLRPATVGALAALDGELYAAGDFTTAGATSAKCIARWDPAAST